VAVGSLRWLSIEVCREQAGTGTGADSFGREPHTARERVESQGADDRARTEFGHGPEVCVRTVGADCRAHARSTALAELLRHSVITCTRFVSCNIQWIWKKKEKEIVITCNRFGFFTTF
jgi:hypothetical protein